MQTEAAFGSGVQHYQVIDAEQPWLPNGPIPTNVEWSLSGGDRHGAMA